MKLAYTAISIAILGLPLAAQSVSQVDNSNPAISPNMVVGDSFSTLISGPAGAAVYTTDSYGTFYDGVIPASGTLTLSGTGTNAGQYSESFTAGGVNAGTVNFFVLLALPTAQITNTTRDGSAIFAAGDFFTLTVTGPPNQAVTATTSQNGIPGSIDYGETGSNGNFSGTLSFSGVITAGDVGTWTEQIYVAGIAASSSLSYTVYPASELGCDFAVAANPPVMTSIDFIDVYGYIAAQDLGTGDIGALFASSGECVLYSYRITYPAQPASQQQPIFFGQIGPITPYEDVYAVYDTGMRPLDLNAFYPYTSGAAIYAVGVNLITNEFYYGGAIMDIYITWESY